MVDTPPVEDGDCDCQLGTNYKLLPGTFCSRSSDSNYLDQVGGPKQLKIPDNSSPFAITQGESAKRPVRPPRPALLRSLEVQIGGSAGWERSTEYS